jgi:hypothetical protein
MAFHDAATGALNHGVALSQIMDLPMRDEIAVLKTTPHEDAIKRMQELVQTIPADISGIEVY